MQFANDDTYFGGYQEDLKSGPGIYCFAVGACYMGSYRGGKREGQGIMIMPDGGTYEGEFVADKFEGQVRSLRCIAHGSAAQHTAERDTGRDKANWQPLEAIAASSCGPVSLRASIVCTVYVCGMWSPRSGCCFSAARSACPPAASSN